MNIEIKVKNLIFISEGGIGKTIASTAVVRRLAEEYPDKRIIVVTGYPDIFSYNPHVHKVFNFNNPLYFYDDYITPESHVIKIEPYTNYDYMFNHRHLIDVWCDMIGIESKGALPEMFFMDNEFEASKSYVDKITNNGKKKFVMLQWIGGMVPHSKDKMAVFDVLMRMHKRSLPHSVAQKLANKLVSRNYVVGVVQHENFPDIQGAERLFFPNTPVRGVIALLKFAEGFIGIDSFLQHASVVFNKKGVVLWGGTHPKKLGYEVNTNLTREVCKSPFCHRPDSYVFDANPNTGIWNCPYNTKCMEYDADEIINAYEDVVKDKSVKKKEEKQCQKALV
jgi:ADP-heptose:LPS heptosyltransferase